MSNKQWINVHKIWFWPSKHSKDTKWRLKYQILRPSFPGHDVNFLSKFNSQVMWNLLFEPLIGNFKSDVKFLIWIFFLWQLISCQTLKLRPKINVCKKNQISDRKIKSCWIDLIWNLLLDLTWFIFAVFDVKSWPGKEGHSQRNQIISFWHSIYYTMISYKFYKLFCKPSTKNSLIEVKLLQPCDSHLPSGRFFLKLGKLKRMGKVGIWP